MENQTSTNSNQETVSNRSESLQQTKRTSTLSKSRIDTNSLLMTTSSFLRHCHSSVSSNSVISSSAERLQLLLRSLSMISTNITSSHHSLKEPLLLGLSEGHFVAQEGFKKHLPGLRHYSQGTEETSRPKPSIHPPARSVSRSQNLPTKSTLGTDQSDINSSNSDTQSQTQRTGSPSASVTPTIPIAFVRSNMASTSSSTTTSSRNNEDSEENSSPPPSSSSSSPSPSSSSTPSTPTSASGRSGSATSNTVFGTRSSTSTLLISTTQEFNQIWAQTTAFLYRTFSPTYRLGNLYIESWTNGTQVRGFERLRTSLLRGDPFALLHNMTGRLQGLWRRSIAEAAEIERKLRAMEKSKSGQGKAREAKPANTSSSNKSNNSNGGGENNNNNNTSSSNSNGSSNSESRK